MGIMYTHLEDVKREIIKYINKLILLIPCSNEYKCTLVIIPDTEKGLHLLYKKQPVVKSLILSGANI